MSSWGYPVQAQLHKSTFKLAPHPGCNLILLGTMEAIPLLKQAEQWPLVLMVP